MKSHDLAHYLLHQPNGEVLLETHSGRDPIAIVHGIAWLPYQRYTENRLIVLTKPQENPID